MCIYMYVCAGIYFKNSWNLKITQFLKWPMTAACAVAPGAWWSDSSPSAVAHLCSMATRWQTAFGTGWKLGLSSSWSLPSTLLYFCVYVLSCTNKNNFLIFLLTGIIYIYPGTFLLWCFKKILSNITVKVCRIIQVKILMNMTNRWLNCWFLLWGSLG